MPNALLEVIVLDAPDARLAVEGGADRLELVSAMQFSASILPSRPLRRLGRRWMFRCAS